MSAADDPETSGASRPLSLRTLSSRPSPPTAFPVEAPYRMRPDLARLDGPVFEVRSDDDALRAEKAVALRQRPQRVRVPDPGRDADAVAADVAATLPRIAELRPDAITPATSVAQAQAQVQAQAGSPVTVVDVRGRAWAFPALDSEAHELLQAAPPATRVADALALSLPDDLAWMRDDGAAGRASLLHVSFPSHWTPDARAGASLAELHGPVADGEALRAASTALMRAIVRKGPFLRFVWSVQPTPALDLHPEADHGSDDSVDSNVDSSVDRGEGAGGGPASPIDGAVARNWFRVERQTTLPFPAAGLALFAIRVQVAPLAQVLAAGPGRAARLAASVRSMSAGVRAYKGLGAADTLLEELDAWTESESGANGGH